MEWKNYRIHCHDELPYIGSGHRTVMAKVGRKWVRVKSRVHEKSWPSKIKLKTWNVILVKELE